MRRDHAFDVYESALGAFGAESKRIVSTYSLKLVLWSVPEVTVAHAKLAEAAFMIRTSFLFS